MGNEQQGGCFRSNTLGKSRIQLYDMGRVTSNNVQTKINGYSQSLLFNDQKIHKKQSMSVGKIHQPIFQVQKKLAGETQSNLMKKNGSTQSQSDYLNYETNLKFEEVKKKIVFSQEIISQTASLQGKNSTETSDSQRLSMIERIKQRKQDPLDTSEVSMTHFNLPLETIVRQNKSNEQSEQKKKKNERLKGRRNDRNERPKQRKSQRSNQTVDTTKLNSEQKLNVKQVPVEKQKRKIKNEKDKREQKSNEGNKKRSRGRQRIQKRGQQENVKMDNRNCIDVWVGNRFDSYGL